MLIWQKHITKKLVSTFFFFLFTLFFVYILVDFSAHGVRFLSRSTFADLVSHYLFTFSALLDLFFTLTFLLATMRVLHDLNSHREILALQMAYLSKKKLLTPFFIFATALCTICYINSQWIAPNAQETVSTFRAKHKSKKKKQSSERVFSISLKDNSTLVYQFFDQEKNELFDVFWIRSPADIWHMKTLHIKTLKASHIDHLIRKDHRLEKERSYPEKTFKEIPWEKDAQLNSFIPFESRAISTLFSQSWSDSTEKRPILSHLFYKLLLPLMPFLVLISISPYMLSYSRNFPFFLIIAFAIFGFISLKIIMDGMLILGENSVLPSFIAIWGPILVSFGLFSPKFLRL